MSCGNCRYLTYKEQGGCRRAWCEAWDQPVRKAVAKCPLYEPIEHVQSQSKPRMQRSLTDFIEIKEYLWVPPSQRKELEDQEVKEHG